MKTPYVDGYERGYTETSAGMQHAVDAAAIQEALEDVGLGLSDAQLSNWWLGYYHGRYHARHGRPAAGALHRAGRN